MRLDVLRTEYFLFVFLAACGLVQVVAAHAGLKGLLFLNGPLGGYALGVGLIVGAFAWFFATGNRNVPGIEGSGQFGLFLAGAFGAVFFTLLLTSIIKPLWGFGRGVDIRQSNPGHKLCGFEALKRMSFGQALVRGLFQRHR